MALNSHWPGARILFVRHVPALVMVLVLAAGARAQNVTRNIPA